MNGKKSSVKHFSRIWVYVARLSFFLKVLKNTVPFATGSCLKFRVDVFAVEWKAPKVSLWKLFSGHCVFSSVYELIFILIGQFCKIDINFDQYLKPLKSHMWLFQAPSWVESKLVRCKKDEPTIQQIK